MSEKEMVTLKFKGAEPELMIECLGYKDVFVKRGGTFEVPAKDAESLLKRGDFEAVEGHAKAEEKRK